ncbi:MAG: hypothetical protein ACRDLB_04890, partial [Actinomycetota bacterium]
MTKNIDRLLDAVRERRAEYEARQDEVEDARRDYYRAVERLHEAGMPLREIAEALGLSHQRVHQMVGEAQGPSRAGRLARRVARGGTAVLIALALAGGGVILGTQIDGPDDVPVASPDRSRTSSSGTESEAIEEAEAELRKMMSCLDTTLHEKKAGISA